MAFVITTQDVAARCGCTELVVRQLVQRGIIPPAIRLGDFHVFFDDDLPTIKQSLLDAGYITTSRDPRTYPPPWREGAKMDTPLPEGATGQTITEMADDLGTTPNTVWRWVHRGVKVPGGGGARLKLRATRWPGGWRVNPADLREFIEAMNAPTRA